MLQNKLTLFILLLATAFTAFAKQWGVDELPNVQKQDHTKHLVNPDGIVGAQAGAQIDSLLLDARRRSSAEIVAVIVDDIDSNDMDSYATELFNTWGIGKNDKNNGILVLVAKDRREAKIRTGYGAEGIMPDILAGRILRNEMFPRFKDGDYEGGMLAGVKAIHKMVTDPDAASELKSGERDNYAIYDKPDFVGTYLKVAAVAAIILMVWLIAIIMKFDKGKNKMSDYQKYQYLKSRQLIFWIISLVFIGIPIAAALILVGLKYYYRNHGRKCPRCHTPMKKQSEEEDNKYLTYAQDLEERIKSVDYDVWLCPHCGEKDIYSFLNTSSNYTECPKCHAHTEKLTGTRIISEPTYSRNGQGEKIYSCLNCQNQRRKKYSIPKKEKPVVIVAPGGGGGRGFGGGGFGGGGFGGGFGGGLTGGGGAGGRW